MTEGYLTLNERKRGDESQFLDALYSVKEPGSPAASEIRKRMLGNLLRGR